MLKSKIIEMSQQDNPKTTASSTDDTPKALEDQLTQMYESFSDFNGATNLTSTPLQSSNDNERQENPTTARSEKFSESADIKTTGIQRLEDLQRARYLNKKDTDLEKNKQQEESKATIKKKRPSCWVTTTWVLTCWTPPVLLKACGIDTFIK